jgi:hypothetical protein
VKRLFTKLAGVDAGLVAISKTYKALGGCKIEALCCVLSNENHLLNYGDTLIGIEINKLI